VLFLYEVFTDFTVYCNAFSAHICILIHDVVLLVVDLVATLEKNGNEFIVCLHCACHESRMKVPKE